MDKKKLYMKPVVIVLRIETNGMLADSIPAKDDQFTEEAESKNNTFGEWEEFDNWE